MPSSLLLAVAASIAAPANHVATTTSAQPPCCFNCTPPSVFYYSVVAASGYCGVSCLDPAKEWLYKKFEANLTRAPAGTTTPPCATQLSNDGEFYTKYAFSETHGVPGLLSVAVDFYRQTHAPPHACCQPHGNVLCIRHPVDITIEGVHYCCPRGATVEQPCANKTMDPSAPQTNGASIVPSVTLNNGVSMPVLAFAANVWDADTCASATTSALKAGFTFVWSSQLVGDACQRAQARVLNQVQRSSVFVAGTADTQSCRGEADCYTQTKAAASHQLDIFGSPLDMLMLDYPPGDGTCDSIRGQWRAFEEAYRGGQAKSIAVSNFSPTQVKCITANATATPPAANQLPLSVGKSTQPIRDDADLRGVIAQAYSPLGTGSLASDPLLKRIGAAHGKSAAQVALKWLLTHNATIATQSTSASHLSEDVQLFDFSLTADEMRQLDAYHP